MFDVDVENDLMVVYLPAAAVSVEAWPEATGYPAEIWPEALTWQDMQRLQDVATALGIETSQEPQGEWVSIFVSRVAVYPDPQAGTAMVKLVGEVAEVRGAIASLLAAIEDGEQ